MSPKCFPALLQCLACAVWPGPALAGHPDSDRPPASPASSRADLDAIEKAITAGRLTQARLMLGQLEARTAAGPHFDLVLGRYYLAQHQDALALDCFERALAGDPSVPAATDAGMASLRLGQPVRARTYLDKALAENSRDGRAWNGLGMINDAARDWKAAEAAYRNALRVAPDEPAFLNNFGYSLILQRRFAEAAAVLGRAASALPREPVIETNLAIARALSGDYPQAADPSGANPDLARQLNNAGYAAWLNGDIPAARALLARAIEARATHYGLAERNLALVERDLGK